MWQSLIRSDLEGIKQSSKALGVEEMYGLLACILTARSWEVITTGIDQGPVTHDEVCGFVEIEWSNLLCCFDAALKNCLWALQEIKRLAQQFLINQRRRVFLTNQKEEQNHLWLFSLAFSRVCCGLRVFNTSSDWFTAFVVIGQISLEKNSCLYALYIQLFRERLSYKSVRGNVERYYG